MFYYISNFNIITYYIKQRDNMFNLSSNVICREQFGLQVVQSATDPKTKEKWLSQASSTLVDWKKCIQTRFETTVHLYSRRGAEAFNDENVMSTYNAVVRGIQNDIKKIREKPGVTILILLDSQQRVQSISSLKEKKDQLLVRHLLSAPWNIAMHSPNTPQNQAMAVKGAGTTMMRQAYEFARVKNKASIKIFSFPTAVNFYKNHLKMSLSGDCDRTFYFKVSKEELPESLKVSSGNLLAVGE